MAARPVWSGFLKLSLVSVPVKAYTATDSGGEVHLNQLHWAALEKDAQFEQVVGTNRQVTDMRPASCDEH